MQKVVINGSCNKETISNLYKENGIEIFYNLECTSFKMCNEFSAVFFVNDYNEKEMQKWIGNNHLRICLNEQELIDEINFFLGIPKPLEIERKFLIKYPDIKKLNENPNCKGVEISQCYIDEPNERYRVRKRGIGDECLYIKTQKFKISEIKRIEIEELISKEIYEDIIKNRPVLSKVRYLCVYKNKYFELDVFPFWSDKAFLEIELKSENEEFEIPDYLEVIKEVSNDKNYRNISLAKKYAKVSK